MKTHENLLTFPAIDTEAPAQFETATFALGWFWGPDSQFGSIHGVIRTRVGYAGGTSPNPTYYKMGDHAESIQIDFDPKVISYEDLLKIFWESHAPVRPAWSRQYMSGIFYHDDMQKELAIKTRDQQAAFLKREIHTEIAELDRFYMAEDYHQKYYLQQDYELMSNFQRIYPEMVNFTASTAVARVNGYVGGNVSAQFVANEVRKLGLSEENENRLKKLAARKFAASCRL